MHVVLRSADLHRHESRKVRHEKKLRGFDAFLLYKVVLAPSFFADPLDLSTPRAKSHLGRLHSYLLYEYGRSCYGPRRRVRG